MDGAEVGARFEHVLASGTPERVRRDVFVFDGGPLAQVGNQLIERHAVQGFTGLHGGNGLCSESSPVIADVAAPNPAPNAADPRSPLGFSHGSPNVSFYRCQALGQLLCVR